LGFGWKTKPNRKWCIKMPTYEIFINGKPKKIELTKTSETIFNVKIDGKIVNVELHRNEADAEKQFSIKIGDKKYKIKLPELNREKPFQIKTEEAIFNAEIKTPSIRRASNTFETTPLNPIKKTTVQKQIVEGAVTAPMTGKIISVKVKKGEKVEMGQALCIIEAMKMENEINAPKAGIIQEVNVAAGASVSEGEVLFVIG